jgi:hypothetical protein
MAGCAFTIDRYLGPFDDSKIYNGMASECLISYKSPLAESEDQSKAKVQRWVKKKVFVIVLLAFLYLLS